MKKILANKTYLAVIASDLLSNFGDTLYYMALMNYVLFLPNPNFALSIITLSETLPTFSRLITGFWSDKTKDKLKAIQLTLVFRITIYTILGFIMTFEPALWIVIVAAIFNFFSDVAGQYENGLYIPISLRIIPNEDRAEYMGFSQSLGLTTNLLFQSAGALFITMMSFSQLAFVNAATFAVSLLMYTIIKPRIAQLFAQKPLETSENKRSGNIFKDMWQSLKLTLSEMAAIPDLKACMIIVPVLNGLGAVLITLLTLIMSHNKEFMIFNAATTLAIFQTTNIIGMILGGILSMNLLKNLSISHTLQVASALFSALIFAYYLQNIWLILIFLIPIGIISGAINPKLNTLIYTRISENKIATVSAGIYTWFTTGIVITRLLMSGLMLFLSVKWLTLLLFLLSLGLLGYTINDFIRKKVI